MEESAERELKRAERSNQPVGVIMLDVDHFKRFNDEYGHSAGDQVMRELGALLLSKVRGEDIVCRYGGEEIAIILPNANAEIVAQRAESLRAAIKSLRVAHGGRMLGALTASFGVAAYPEHGKTCAELVRRADRALYEAKRSGRDRVVVFDGVGGTFDLGPRPVVAVAATH
jgi:diguanylate cyclase (GGDEF)-like protein